jgi:putative DNA primase/helicase
MQQQQLPGESSVAPTHKDPVSTAKSAPDQPAAKSFRPEGHRKSTRNGETEKSQGGKPFSDVTPFPEPIDPAALLDAIFQLFLRFMVMSADQARAATLWVAMTWFIDVIKVAPLAIITAPERECGKSVLLEIFSRLVARPLSVANSSAAFLFRAIQAWVVTLLVDEADMFARQNEELQGLINAGHTRSSAFVGRVVKVGDAFEPRTFSVWCPKALAGIRLERHLPDATISRGVVFNLRRKLPGESVVRLRHAESGEFELLTSQLARFAADYAVQVRNARPPVPDQLGDRAYDNWEPLVAIAQCAGPEWVEHARKAALALSATKPDENVGSELLADIRGVFDAKSVSRITTADLLAALIDDPEAPWGTYNRGKPLTARQLSKMLGAYDIHSKTVRFGSATPKGFELGQFQDAFARYLTPLQGRDAPDGHQKIGASGFGTADCLPADAF